MRRYCCYYYPVVIRVAPYFFLRDNVVFVVNARINRGRRVFNGRPEKNRPTITTLRDYVVCAAGHYCTRAISVVHALSVRRFFRVQTLKQGARLDVEIAQLNGRSSKRRSDSWASLPPDYCWL